MNGCDLLRDALKKAHAQQLAATREIDRPAMALFHRVQRQEADLVLDEIDRMRPHLNRARDFDAAVFALAGVDQ